jgi:hypothetical protein
MITFRVNAHAGAQRRRRRFNVGLRVNAHTGALRLRRRFNVGRVLVLDNTRAMRMTWRRRRRRQTGTSVHYEQTVMEEIMVHRGALAFITVRE